MAYQHFPVLVTSSAIANLFAFFAENISFVDKSKISVAKESLMYMRSPPHIWTLEVHLPSKAMFAFEQSDQTNMCNCLSKRAPYLLNSQMNIGGLSSKQRYVSIWAIWPNKPVQLFVKESLVRIPSAICHIPWLTSEVFKADAAVTLVRHKVDQRTSTWHQTETQVHFSAVTSVQKFMLRRWIQYGSEPQNTDKSDRNSFARNI